MVKIKNNLVRLILWFLMILLCTPFVHAQEQSLLLFIKPVEDDFFQSAQAGTDPLLTSNAEGKIVIGTINPPELSVQDISHIALYDAAGRLVPLQVEKSTVYSEFDDSEINGMRIKFVATDTQIVDGAFRFVWGGDVSSPNNSFVDRFVIYDGDRQSYQTFTWEKQPHGDDAGTYSATLEVIVDDQADTYYLWYLLPLGLIFGLLLVRRLFTG